MEATRQEYLRYLTFLQTSSKFGDINYTLGLDFKRKCSAGLECVRGLFQMWFHLFTSFLTKASNFSYPVILYCVEEMKKWETLKGTASSLLV